MRHTYEAEDLLGHMRARQLQTHLFVDRVSVGRDSGFGYLGTAAGRMDRVCVLHQYIHHSVYCLLGVPLRSADVRGDVECPEDDLPDADVLWDGIRWPDAHSCAVGCCFHDYRITREAMTILWPSHPLQRTRPSRSGIYRRALLAAVAEGLGVRPSHASCP